MRADTIDAPRALAVFGDGKPHTAREVAVACQVHSRTAAWFLSRMRDRGMLRQIPPSRSLANQDFGAFVRKEAAE